MTSTFRLGRVRGIEIGIHWSLLVAGVLVARLPRERHPPGPRTGRRWVVLGRGVLATALFFGSILAHELSHALVVYAPRPTRRGHHVVAARRRRRVCATKRRTRVASSSSPSRARRRASGSASGSRARRGARRDARRREHASRGRDLPGHRQPRPRGVQPVAPGRRARRRPHAHRGAVGVAQGSSPHAQIAASRCGVRARRAARRLRSRRVRQRPWVRRSLDRVHRLVRGQRVAFGRARPAAGHTPVRRAHGAASDGTTTAPRAGVDDRREPPHRGGYDGIPRERPAHRLRRRAADALLQTGALRD